MAEQTKLEPGVYLDGARGHYLVRDVINFAKDQGFPVDPFLQFTLDMYEEHYELIPCGSLDEVATEAEDWLNENQPLDGHYWAFIDGDFGLWADDLAHKD